MSAEPYLSIVATSRNDDHGGNLRQRMQLFVNGWIEQCRRHRLDSELLLVEWNPPPERAPLASALRWPSDTGPCHVRIVTVPPEIHRRYRHAEALPLFQMIAKNVGIRRARAPFVLATNIDILFNDELMTFLAARRLERGRLYRIDRSDTMADVPPAASVAEQLEYCRTHLLRLNAREGTFAAGPERQSAPVAGAADGIRFGAGFGSERTATDEAYEVAEGEALLSARGPCPGGRVLKVLVDAGPNPDRDTLVLEIRDEAGHDVARVRFRGRRWIYVPLESPEAEVVLRLRVAFSRPRRSGPRQPQLRVFESGWATDGELRREGLSAEREARAVVVRDVFEPGEGITLQEGWGEREWTPDLRPFRAIRGRAVFAAFTPARLPGRLALDLDSDEPVGVQVRTANAVIAAASPTAGPRRLTIPSPLPSERAAQFSIELTRLAPGGPARGSLAHGRVHGLRRFGLGPSLRTMLRPFARPRIDYLHTNGCGDFTLMHRDHWIRLRGYPEWEAYSMNIDGFTCYAAHADGVVETVLRPPLRVYHIEHGLGSGWSPEGEQLLHERITARGIRWIGKEEVLGYARRMYREGPLVVNGPTWGLAEEELSEVQPGLVGSPGEAGEGRE